MPTFDKFEALFTYSAMEEASLLHKLISVPGASFVHDAVVIEVDELNIKQLNELLDATLKKGESVKVVVESHPKSHWSEIPIEREWTVPSPTQPRPYDKAMAKEIEVLRESNKTLVATNSKLYYENREMLAGRRIRQGSYQTPDPDKVYLDTEVNVAEEEKKTLKQFAKPFTGYHSDIYPYLANKPSKKVDSIDERWINDPPKVRPVVKSSTKKVDSTEKELEYDELRMEVQQLKAALDTMGSKNNILRVTADRALGFITGLNLRYHSIQEQQAALEIVRRLREDILLSGGPLSGRREGKDLRKLAK